VFPQLSFELTFEKIEAHFFFEKKIHVTLKKSYFEFGTEIEKNGCSEVSIGFQLPCAKFE
jgi:hypothetical protein